MRIILLEFIDEVDAIIKDHGKEIFLSKDTVTVCLDPKVRVFLNKLGIASVDTIEFLPNEAQHRIVLASEKLTVQLVDQLDLKDEFGIKQGYRDFCIHHMRLYVNHLLWIVEILRGIQSKYQIGEIVACLPRNPVGMYLKKGYIQPSERFLGLITQEFCLLNKYKFTKSFYPKAKNNIFKLCFDRFINGLACGIGILSYKFFLKENSGQEQVIVVPSLSYKMGSLLKEVMGHQPYVKNYMVLEDFNLMAPRADLAKVYLIVRNLFTKHKKENVVENVIYVDLIRLLFPQRRDIREKFSNEFNALIENLKNVPTTVYDGINLAPYLKGKIGVSLQADTLLLNSSTAILAQIFKKLKPSLLMSMFSSSIFYQMGELSNVLGFRSLNISHGTHVPPNNEIEKIENYRLSTSVIINTYNNVAVQTPWADKFLDYYGDTRPRILTGPLLYSVTTASKREKLREEVLGAEHNDMKIIVHATTQKARTSLRFHITETLDEYIATLRDIVDAVNKDPKLFFIIKPHPACNFTIEDFSVLLPECKRMTIIKKRPFEDVLSASDLLISYSSTCIEEAIQNKIPVVLFDKWKRYNHFGIGEIKHITDLIRSPACYVTEPALLGASVDRMLGFYSLKEMSDNELKNYKYPVSYRQNFVKFVNSSLGAKEFNKN